VLRGRNSDWLPKRNSSISVDDKKEIASDLAFTPYNEIVTPLLTDLYELTMVYSYFMLKKHTETAVFDLFFRKCPFKGEYVVFCGLEDCLRFLNSFRFTEDDLAYLKEMAPSWDPLYFEFLRNLDCSQVKLYAQPEGGVCYPRIPMLRVEGPLGVCQLLETTLLNLVNFSSLIGTNAARHRQVVGRNVVLLEFGLRRAQGPDGGMSASRYSFIGGYDGSSNVAAGKIFNIPVKGTHAHSYVSSFQSFKELNRSKLPCAGEQKEEKHIDILKRALHWRKELKAEHTNEGELTAFIAYALDYPNGFIALIDTYNALKSGMLNFVVVAMALVDAGYRPIGVRIDSGDIVAQSIAIKAYFTKIGNRYKREEITNAAIFASDGISEDSLHDYAARGECSAYGVGTNLVTCKKQPALGGVYKLVELGGKPRIKLSEDPLKITIPGKKNAFRVFDKQNQPICDVMATMEEGVLQCGVKHSFRHFTGTKNGKTKIVEVTKIDKLLNPCWDNGAVVCALPVIQDLRTYCINCVYQLPEKHRRKHNPEPYTVLLTERLYQKMTEMIAAQSQS